MGIFKDTALLQKVVNSPSEQYNRNRKGCDDEFLLPYLHDTFWIRIPNNSFVIGLELEVWACVYDCITDTQLGCLRFYYDGNTTTQQDFRVNIISSNTVNYGSLAIFDLDQSLLESIVGDNCCFYFKFEYLVASDLLATAYSEQMKLVTSDNINDFVTFETPKYNDRIIDCLGRGYLPQDNITEMVFVVPTPLNWWSNRITLPCSFGTTAVVNELTEYGSTQILRKIKSEERVSFEVDYVPRYVINELSACLDYLPQEITVYHGSMNMDKFDTLKYKGDSFIQYEEGQCQNTRILNVGLYQECENLDYCT
jgi:hypothetical protein